MPLTRYKSAITILSEDIANSWFGGLYGQVEASDLDPLDPLVAGHVHDGLHLDGHAQKVNLGSHTTGQLDGVNLVDESVTQGKLDPSILFGSSVDAVNFVFRPGGTNSFNVYSDFTALYASLSSQPGKRVLYFDDSIVSPCVIPAGTYDFENVSWKGLGQTIDGTGATPYTDVSVPISATITNLNNIEFLEVQATGAGLGPIKYNSGTTESLVLINSWIKGDTTPFSAVSGGTTLKVAAFNSLIGDSLAGVFYFTDAGNDISFSFTNTTSFAATVGGASSGVGNTISEINLDASSQWLQTSAFTPGYPAFNLDDDSALVEVSLTNMVTVTSTNVQGALEDLDSTSAELIKNPVRGVLGMTNAYPIQIGVDGSGDLTGTVDTITFESAPSAILVRKIIMSAKVINTDDPNVFQDTNISVYLSAIKIDGVAIDSEGIIQMKVYDSDASQSFDLNIPLAIGEDLSIEVTSLSKDTIASFCITYDEQPAILPSGINSFVGTTGGFSVVAADTDSATTTITIDSAPVTQDTLAFVNNVLGLNESLSGVAVARTSGNDDFDATIGTTTGIATEIAAAINDGSNSFTGVISAIASGSDIDLTIAGQGHVANLTSITSAIPELTNNDFFSGATAGALTTLTLDTVTFDCTLRNIFFFSTLPMSIESIKLNGTAISTGRMPSDLFDLFGLNGSSRYSPNFDIALTNGDVITVEVINATASSAALAQAIVELP